MNYVNAKLGFALSLRNMIDEETFENEFDNSPLKYMNHMIWGDKNLSEKQLIEMKKLLESDTNLD